MTLPQLKCRLSAILHLLRGRKYYFAAVTGPRNTGFDISICVDLPDEKRQQDAFLVGSAIHLDALIHATANVADTDIEEMLRAVE